MKKSISILMFLAALTGLAQQYQDFSDPVKFLAVETADVDDVEFFYAPASADSMMAKVAKEDVVLFNSSQKARILYLIYINGTSTFSVFPSSGERGVSTALTVNYNIISNDDVFGTASINQGIGSVTSDVDAGAKTASGGSSVVSKTFVLALFYTRQGVATDETKSATYTSYIPQWRGVSDETDFTTYAGLNSELTKFVQSSAATSMTVSPSAEYIWFVSNKNNATILDQNNFTQTVGTWGDGVSEFYSKSLLLTLADGTTTSTVYLYRSRNTKTFTDFTYKIQ